MCSESRKSSILYVNISNWHLGLYLGDTLLGVHLHHDFIRYSDLCTLCRNEAIVFSPILSMAMSYGLRTFPLVRDK